MAGAEPGTAEYTAAESGGNPPVTVGETPEPPAPFPDQPIESVAAVLGALAGLATRDPALYGTSVETLAITEEDGPDWAAVVADTLVWVLSVHGITADDLWQGYYALSERMTEGATAAPGEG